ncbi:hypothetical protein [Geobacillus sp. TFV-3]|uniref:hypothetical protein n=1 Tax=Geobacillus sp. TFV-3 TaxID=1897059 RepID=UPI00135C346C|nr:hypothetical protein [Geobacillus sp. TFV-3]
MPSQWRLFLLDAVCRLEYKVLRFPYCRLFSWRGSGRFVFFPESPNGGLLFVHH